MAKTFEALMKAEMDKREKSGELNLPSSPEYFVPMKSNIPSHIMEEYHRMKYRIVNICPGRKSKVLLFTCPQEGEGNSTIVTHFAITLASEGERVILVDTNLRTPAIHRFFNLDFKMGFSEWILKKCTLEEVFKKTFLGTLQVITSGNTYSDPFSIITLPSLDPYIERLKAKADWVLFDTPPIQSHNDAIALAPKMDGVVMVVQAEKTRWEVVQSVKQRLESGNAKIIGVVLNKRRFYIPGWLYRKL